MEGAPEAEPDLLKSRVEFTPPPAGATLASELLAGMREHANRTLLVDALTGRELSGAGTLERCGAIATGLVRQLGLKPNDVVMSLCERDITEALVAVGVVLAGGSLYPALVSDGYSEVEVLCQLASPKVVISSTGFRESALKLRRNVPGCRDMKILLVDQQAKSAASNGNSQQQHQQQQQQQQQQQNGHSKAAVYDENNNEIVQEPYMYSLSELEAQNAYDSKLLDDIAGRQIKPTEHVASMMLTSGSTGKPKVVPSTHEEVVVGLYSMLSAARNPFPAASAACNTEDDENNGLLQPQQQTGETYLLPVSQDDVMAGDLPLDHGAGLNLMFLALRLGCKYLVMPSFDVELFWRACAQYRVTFSLSSTSFGYALFKRLKQLIDARETHKCDLSAFRFIGCCGAKMTFVDLVHEVLAHEAFAHLEVCQAYGCTENGFISMGLGRERQHLESAGFLFPGLLAKVVDYTQQEHVVPQGQRGEFLLWSRSLFKRYISSHSNPAQVFADCHDARGLFYRSGDQAHLDAAGRIHLHGRFKDTLVLWGDWKVMPAELEAILSQHPLVETCVIVGTPDPETPGCHAPRAFVKLVASLDQLDGRADGQQVALEPELRARMLANDRDYLARHMAEFFAARTAREKHLRAGVRILDEFPRVGLLRKIDRKALLQFE